MKSSLRKSLHGCPQVLAVSSSTSRSACGVPGVRFSSQRGVQFPWYQATVHPKQSGPTAEIAEITARLRPYASTLDVPRLGQLLVIILPVVSLFVERMADEAKFQPLSHGDAQHRGGEPASALAEDVPQA